MANFNLTITDEGAAFLASVIANQGNIDFTEVRFSSNNYVGQESSLTEGTWAGTFVAVAPSASVVDSTTINIESAFNNTSFTTDHDLYSIGVIGDDGNTTALIAVATTSTPDIISKFILNTSNYVYNIDLTVSSTADITVSASTAGVVFVADIVDNLTSEETNKPLSARQGKVLKNLIDQGTGMKPHIIITSDSGSTVTLTLGGDTITAEETSSGIFEANVNAYGTYTISSELNGDTVTTTLIVDAVKIYTVTLMHFSATITVNYPDNMRGETFTCVNGGTTLTETAPSNANTFNFIVHSAGVWTVTGAYSKTVTITTSGETQSITFYALKTFATATDQEIANMVQEADLGYIDLYEDAGWRVGQEHNISLEAIAASGTYDGISWTVGEAQTAQTVPVVLMHGDAGDTGLPELVTPVLDKQGQARNTCSFVWGMKLNLDTKGYMNSTATSAGSWDACARRNWCNGGFYGSLPSAFRSACKQTKVITASEYNSSTNQTSNDYIFLAAEKQVFGVVTNGQQNEGDALTQFNYYITSTNRVKSSMGWWLRSPFVNQASYFQGCNYAGNPVGNHANTENGISVHGCF